ncbi:hypothetical protein PVL29_011031 [Vitis rotundifolia]|uniref:Uncharacterized protein n=1 Tax=Vitis rotundifolia TaxID=103349 RepID=A0AA38ZWY4_VITRO|nr:hypothetical protein PVL29_011031 [Vitis rotundifolia]
MHDLVGTWQENCFLMIIVVSMGNRYNSLLELPFLTMRISSFLSCIFFTLNMIYFSLIIKVGPSFFLLLILAAYNFSIVSWPLFFFCAYVSSMSFSILLRYLIFVLVFICDFYIQFLCVGWLDNVLI